MVENCVAPIRLSSVTLSTLFLRQGVYDCLAQY
jgi:hypothetical protein